jgi:predicted esterase
MIPLDRAYASMALLEQAGAQVTYYEEEVGHKLGAAGMRALENYLQD